MYTTSSTPALVGPTPGVGAFTPVQLLRLTQLFASDPALADTLGPDPERPGERSWRLLADSPQLQVWLIRWPVGTGTGWHDHGGARGGFTVVRGTLTEHTRERSVVATDLDEGEVAGVLDPWVIERNVLEWRLDPRQADSLRSIGIGRATDVVGGFAAWRDLGLPVARLRAA